VATVELDQAAIDAPLTFGVWKQRGEVLDQQDIRSGVRLSGLARYGTVSVQGKSYNGASGFLEPILCHVGDVVLQLHMRQLALYRFSALPP
jgi:hypothetical protein